MAKLKKEFEDVEPVKAKEPVVKKPVEVDQYISTVRLFHPYQNLYIDNTPTYVKLDSWLESQIEAGLVSKV